MPLNLKTTSQEFTLENESGYKFEVKTIYDPEFGWDAYVSMSTHGFKTSEGAIDHLKGTAEWFLRLLTEADSDRPPAVSPEARYNPELCHLCQQIHKDVFDVGTYVKILADRFLLHHGDNLSVPRGASGEITHVTMTNGFVTYSVKTLNVRSTQSHALVTHKYAHCELFPIRDTVLDNGVVTGPDGKKIGQRG